MCALHFTDIIIISREILELPLSFPILYSHCLDLRAYDKCRGPHPK